MDSLEERVKQFEMMRLPGQPRAIHMGTSYLINDLWREVKNLRGALDELQEFKVPAPGSQAAAPELLEALERMVGVCAGYLENQLPSDVDSYNPDYVSPLSQARDAIKKARTG